MALSEFIQRAMPEAVPAAGGDTDGGELCSEPAAADQFPCRSLSKYARSLVCAVAAASENPMYLFGKDILPGILADLAPPRLFEVSE